MKVILSKHRPGLTEEELQEIFKNADINKNGLIEFDEFVKAAGF